MPIFRYSGPEIRILKPVLFCHRKWFASLFCVSAILPIYLTASFLVWKKLLFSLRKVTYFVLAKQIWVPYDQNSTFFLRRISLWRWEVGRLCWRDADNDLPSYGNSKKVGRKVSFFVLTIRNMSLYSGKITTYLNFEKMLLNLLTTLPRKITEIQIICSGVDGSKVQLWEAIMRYRTRISENGLRGRIEMGLLLWKPFWVKKVAPFL